jgi:anti-anti-sigma factor
MPSSDTRANNPAGCCVLCGQRLPALAPAEAGCPHCGYGVWFRARSRGGFVIVDLLAAMNPEQAAVDQLYDLLKSSRRSPRLLLNLQQIEFVTSTFLNRLLVLRRKILDDRGRLLLCSPTPVIREIFEINRLDQLFDVFPSEREALGDS